MKGVGQREARRKRCAALRPVSARQLSSFSSCWLVCSSHSSFSLCSQPETTTMQALTLAAASARPVAPPRRPLLKSQSSPHRHGLLVARAAGVRR